MAIADTEQLASRNHAEALRQRLLANSLASLKINPQTVDNPTTMLKGSMTKEASTDRPA